MAPALSELVRPWVVDRGLTLSVVVEMRVAADGSVGRVEVVEGHLPLPLKEPLIQTLHRLRFRPAEADGRAVPARVDLPFFFREGDRAPGQVPQPSSPPPSTAAANPTSVPQGAWTKTSSIP
ncbi:MAG: hypothetical protein GWM92_10275 [Gemmatimonadetes bacterium]|nr:hypothetical protein [Gemmatimonadota bacterium]NIY39811.1 hypothetical protein [Gemmatimonadota bacterium]